MIERKVLVVDDEEHIRDLFKEALVSAGFEVQAVETAERALEIVKNSPYFVLFLDLNLPSMSGIELCKQIRKEYPTAIPIAVTGYASIFNLVECRNAGFEDYFLKPVNLLELIDAAEHAFKKLDRWRKT